MTKYVGEFNFFVDGESKTREELLKMLDVSMSVTVDGINVYYTSQKKQDKKELVKNTLQTLDEMLQKDFETARMGFIPIDSTKEGRQPYKVVSFAAEAPALISDKKWKDYVDTQARKHAFKSSPYLEYHSIDWDSLSNALLTKKWAETKTSPYTSEESMKQKDESPLKKFAEGVKHNQGKLPIDTMLTVQFPKAIQAIAKATLFGHNKYKETDKDWLNYKRVPGGSKTYANSAARHRMNRNGLDSESSLPHIIHEVWNSLAMLELWIEENK